MAELADPVKSPGGDNRASALVLNFNADVVELPARNALVAELVYALASGASSRKRLGVRLSPKALHSLIDTRVFTP